MWLSLRRRVWPLLVAGLTVALAAGPVGAANESLLRNGGFESGLDGSTWMAVGGVVATVETPRQSGSYAVRFDGGGVPNAGLYQVVPVLPGGTYTFRGYVWKNDPTAEEVVLRLFWYDAQDAPIIHFDSAPVVANQEAFVPLSIEGVIAPPTARSVRAWAAVQTEGGASATVFFDDFALEGPPAPTPTATPSPMPTPSPSSTPVALQATATASPAATAATPSPTPAAAATPTATPILTPAAATPMAVATLAPSRPGAAVTGEVLITEVQANPAMGGGDAAWEWFGLQNVTSRPLTLSGWWIEDNVARDPLPDVVLAPGGIVVVAATPRFGDGFPDFVGTVVYVADGRIGNGLANTGDCLILRDAAGRVSDAISWGDDDSMSRPPLPAVAAGHSLVRQGATFVDSAAPSPGRVANAAVVAEPPPTAVAPSMATSTPVSSAAIEAAPTADTAATATPAVVTWRSPVPTIAVSRMPTADATPVAGSRPLWEGLGWIPLAALGAGALWFLLGAVWERWR